MILHDSSLNTHFRDYGIMLPISPARAERVLEFLSKNFTGGTRGKTMPYPGPVLDTAQALAYLGDPPGTRVITRQDITRVHGGDFAAALYGSGLESALLAAYELIDAQGRPHRYEPRRANKPLTDMFQTILGQAGGTYLACRLALAPGAGFCYYLSGGMHHARYDGGAGFCLINDVAIAARKIQEEGRAGLVWVIDLDAHKGDGTAELVRFARERGELAPPPATPPFTGAPCVITLSIHMAKGWPLDAESLAAAREGRAPLLPSDVDIGVDAGEEAAYLSRLEAGVGELERLSAGGTPGLVIVVDGADPYEHDGLPSSALLKLSLDQCVERDRFVYRYLTGRNIPSAWILAGGYGERAWEPPACFLSDVR